LRNELLNGAIFYALRETQIIIESWMRHYNSIRRQASLGYKPPASEVFVPIFTGWLFRYAARLRCHASAISSAKLTFCPDHPMWVAQFTGILMGCGGKE
jgi:hypothetical protein